MPNSLDQNCPPEWNALIDASRAARNNAYAPYSKYTVGAAVLTEEGHVFSGCNVENASYGLTICAERAAVCNAVAAGYQNIVAIALSLTGVAVPCGTCRQFLHEFNPKMLVLLDNIDGKKSTPPECICLEELLPRAFSLCEDPATNEKKA